MTRRLLRPLLACLAALLAAGGALALLGEAGVKLRQIAQASGRAS